MSGNYSYSYESRNNSSSSDYERDDYDSDGRVKQTLRSVSRADGSRSQMHYGSLSGSYEADSLNLVTFSYDFYTWRDNSHGTSSFVMLDAAQVPVYSYNTLDKSLSKYGSHSVGVDYQHSFKKKDELLTVSYKFDNHRSGHRQKQRIPMWYRCRFSRMLRDRTTNRTLRSTPCR